MSLWQVILFPFSILYDLGTSLRNHLYNIGYSKSFDFEVNLISVGNLSVGGTGKSPMVSYLMKLLDEEGKAVTVLSRGYGRSTKGQFFANEVTGATEIGDEPLMLYRRFEGKVPVSVSEDRALGVPGILLEYPDTDVIVLDDAFQHRRIGRDLDLLLTTYDRPFYEDNLLPSGLLRENRKGAKRADVILVTKCPEDLGVDEMEKMKGAIREYAPSAQVFFTTIQYGEPVALKSGDLPDSFVAVSGIAQNGNFLSWCKANYSVDETYNFSDHHRYSKKDLNRIIASMQGEKGLLTTEKDYVKLSEYEELDQLRCFYVPIEVHFLTGESDFNKLIFKSLRQYKDSPVR